MNISQYTALIFGVVIADGFVFSLLPGADPIFSLSKRPHRAALCGIFVTASMVLSTAAAWVFSLLPVSWPVEYLQTLFLVCFSAGLAVALEFALGKLPGTLKAALEIPPRGIAVNSAVLGGALIFIHSGETLTGALSAAAAAGVGFTVTGILLAGVRERVALTSNCPKAMEGLPITLVAAGLLALAFSGFSGLRI